MELSRISGDRLSHELIKFVCFNVLETGAEQYAWLNGVQAVAAGQVDASTGLLVYNIYEARPVAEG